MKLSTAALAVAAIAASVTSRPLLRRDVNPALVPEFGVQSGVNPDGTGNCDGITVNGKPALIPCQCPPPRDKFLQLLNENVAAGFVVNNPAVRNLQFPEDNSKASQRARLFVATVTLQNIEGPGKGCPQVSTTFGAQVQAIDSQPDTPASSSSSPPASAPPAQSSPAPPATSPSPAPAPPANNSTSSTGVDPALVPEFGVQAGVNPDGTGNCDGIVVNGKPALIPCQCPPPRDKFLQLLNENVAAGFVVNNPDVKGLQFPTDDSKQSKLARLHVATVTLQNIEGPGKGCPQVATTFGAQAQAIEALPN